MAIYIYRLYCNLVRSSIDWRKAKAYRRKKRKKKPLEEKRVKMKRENLFPRKSKLLLNALNLSIRLRTKLSGSLHCTLITSFLLCERGTCVYPSIRKYVTSAICQCAKIN